MAGNCGYNNDDLLLSGDSTTVEYGGSSSDCESDPHGLAMISMVHLSKVLVTRK